jgi:RNA polymerase sigma-70 factor (ECF subfamily)
VNYARPDDESLLKQITLGKESALGMLYDRYNRLVFSVALNMVGNQATAEEITIDIFTRVWEKAHTYRSDRARVSTWLTSMTRNRAIDMLRREAARPNRESVSWSELTTAPPSGTDSPETAVDLSLQRERVRAAIKQLAYFKGYSQRQIARERDLPLGTVKTRIRLAMNKLRQLLQDE